MGGNLANRLQAKPVKFPGQPFPETQKYPQITVPTLDGGMNTFVDPNDIQENQFVVAQDIIIREQKLRRRFGESNITPTKPNSNAVKKMYSLKQYDGTLVQLRATDTTLYKRGVSTWTAIANGTGTAFTSAPNNIISVDNRHFFSTNGNRVIKEINLTTNTYSDLGNSAQYKYITAFADRVVGAYNNTGPAPTTIYWSGNLNYGQWDASVDPSAGYKPLEESQSDYADFITGVFGFANQLLVMRERSIWLATKTGSASDPFYFYTASPSVGCDTPGSIQKIPNGVIFFDRRTKSVYTYTIGDGSPVKIGQNVENSIYSSVSDPTTVFSGYDPIEYEYRLAVPLVGTTTTRCWTYNFKAQAWWYEDRSNVTSVDSSDFSVISTGIDDLSGNIDDLSTTIDGLSGNSSPIPEVYYGKSDGNVAGVDTAVNTGYTTLIQSKIWTAPENNDFYIHRLSFTYEIVSEGEFTIWFSKNPNIDLIGTNDPSFTLYKTVTLSTANAGQRVLVNCVKSLKCRQFSWKIQSSSGIFNLIDFKALTEPSGYSR